MSLSNAIIKTALTSFTITGGTDLTYATKSRGEGVMEIHVPADTDFRTRRSMTLTSKDPKVSATAPNGYTQARRKIVLKFPKLNATTGKVTFNTLSVELATDDVVTNDADKVEYANCGAQVLFDPDFLPFLKNGSLE